MLEQLLGEFARRKLGGDAYAPRDGGHYGHGGEGRGPSPYAGGLAALQQALEKARLLPHLKTILICAAAGLLLVLALAAAVLIPLALKLLGLLQHHGLKGLFESVLPFLNLLWQGSGRG